MRNSVYNVKDKDGKKIRIISQKRVSKKVEMKDKSMTAWGECYSKPVTWGGGGGGARVAINDEFAR